MIKVNGLSVSRIPINGKETLRIMKNGQHLWSRTGLPNGYTLLEYIESNGNQYINTGIHPTNTLRVELEYTPLVNNKCVFGSEWSSTGYFLIDWQSQLLWHSKGSTPVAASTILGKKRYVICEPAFCSVDGIVTQIETTQPNTTSYPIYLFWVGNQVNADYKGVIKLYSCKMYNNGVLIRDFIPCMNPEGICGLFDNVNRVFYKSATSNQFTGDYFKEVEYIQSSGTQYIDTGFKPNQNTRVVLSGYNNSTSSGWTFGTWVSSSSGQYAFSCNASYSFRYGTTNKALSNVPIGELNVDFNKNSYYLNGTKGTLTAQSFSCAHNMFLFAINANGSVSSGKFTGKIYSCQIYDNGTLVRDFVPVKGMISGTYGLYDKVNKLFYGSASSNGFTGA